MPMHIEFLRHLYLLDWQAVLTSTMAQIVAAFVLISLIVIILVAVVIQGRELSFWPPRISARPEKFYSSLQIHADVSSLIGEWFEEVPESPERRYSIGTFRFEKRTNICTYDGTNYRTNGDPFCTWRSKVVIVDTASRQVYYIFDAAIGGEMHATNTGFGVLNLEVLPRGIVTFTSGHYIEARDDGQPFTHTMVRLSDVAKELGLARTGPQDGDFYRRVLQAYEKRRKKQMR